MDRNDDMIARLNEAFSKIDTRDEKIIQFADNGEIIQIFNSCNVIHQLSLLFDQLCEVQDKIDKHEHTVIDNTIAFWKRNTNSWQKLIEKIRDHALAVLIRQANQLDDIAAIRLLTIYKEKPLFNKHRSNNVLTWPFATSAVNKINQSIILRIKLKITTAENLDEQRVYQNQLSLHDLLIVIDIYHCFYKFSSTHTDIQPNYYSGSTTYTPIVNSIYLLHKSIHEGSDTIDMIKTICQETLLMFPNVSHDQIYISDIHCRRLQKLLSHIFNILPHNSLFYALVQLDGVLTNFNNYKTQNLLNSNLETLLHLGLTNSLPLPAAEKYLRDHIPEVNQSNVLVNTVSNSCVESALILLKYLSPECIFNIDRSHKNNALQLAIAKGRYHTDSDGKSSLNLGYFIDAIFNIIKNTNNFNIELINGHVKDFTAEILALFQADEKTITQLLEIKVQLKSEPIQTLSENAYEQITKVLAGYTSGKNFRDDHNLLESMEKYFNDHLFNKHDATHYHFGAFSLFKKNIWIQKTANCVALIGPHQQSRLSMAP